jgi:hypothetical protein
MNEHTQESLARILQDFMARPTAQIFIDPVVPGEDCPADYFEIIRKPVCLSEILSKLQSGQYANPNDFLKEIELCWSNAERYYGENDLVTLLAREGRLRFKKMYRSISVGQVPGFCAEAYRLRSRIGKLLSVSPFSDHGPLDGIDPSKNIVKQLPSDTELRNLITATNW